MKNLTTYVIASAIVAFNISNMTASVTAFGLAWANFFVAIACLIVKIDK